MLTGPSRATRSLALNALLPTITGIALLLSSPAAAQSQHNSTQRQATQNRVDPNSPEFAQRVHQQHNAQLAAEKQAAQQRVAQRPFPELPPEQEKYLHNLLDYWQQSSDQVKQYICDFQRFEYDTAIVNYRDARTNQLAAHSIATGQIRYAAPDRGYFETTGMMDFKAPPKAPGQEADYERRSTNGPLEKWICDGRNIYEFDFDAKRLYETEIPKSMQGDGLANSPLPFLFGANKALLLDRYWVRVITPEGATNEYWLEAFPKQIEDARTYSKIEIIIAEEDFLPKAMHMYSPQYDPKKNNYGSRYFAFGNRRVNAKSSQIQDFFGIFVRPQTPIAGGWKRVTRSALEQQQATRDSLRSQDSARATDGPVR
jgi:TIGR03009 family protein